MKVSESEKLKIRDFVASCNDLSNGKFLLVDSKIHNIIKKIQESEELYALIDGLLSGYSFEKEFSHAIIQFVGRPPKFEVPNDPSKLIPLVYSIFVKIDDKSFDFSNFLSTYYHFGEENDFLNFSKDVVIPFKNVISAIFELDDNDNAIKSSEELAIVDKKIKDEDKNMAENTFINEVNESKFDKIFAELEKLLFDMQTEIDFDLKIKSEIRENANLLINAMIEACEMQNLNILNGLIVGFEFIAPKIKCIKFLYLEFKRVMLGLYE